MRMRDNNKPNKDRCTAHKFEEDIFVEYKNSPVVLNELRDPLGHECFRLSPFYRAGYFLEKTLFIILAAILLMIICSSKISFNIFWFTIITFILLVRALVNYVWLSAPAGSLAFLRPGLKKGTWHINMGFLAWVIYNRHISRRDYIMRDFARILRVAYFDRRIKTITVSTWLFKPDNIPQNFPPLKEKSKLCGCTKILHAVPVYLMFRLANLGYPKSGKRKRSPLSSPWYCYTWEFHR